MTDDDALNLGVLLFVPYREMERRDRKSVV